jgi:polyisoprenoid-binding protein YceI
MRHVLTLCLIFCAAMAQAEARHYALQPEASTVGFDTDFGPDHITGTMPILQADLTLDFARVANCKIAVTLDAAHAVASFPFATQALTGPRVLDVRDFPTIAFVSTKVLAEGDGARVEGQVTLRGVTQPMVLHAVVYRPPGSAEGDLGHLSVRLTGQVQRSHFGAVGWADMVGDVVRLDILARIVQP